MIKIARLLAAFFVIVSLNFIIPRIMPGDPLLNLMGENYSASDTMVRELREEMGLNEPMIVQYIKYWGDVFRFDLGRSYHLHDTVASVIRSRLPWTLGLVGTAVLLGGLLGTFWGAVSGWSGGPAGRVSSLLSLVITSTPPFFLALLLLYVFAFELGLFPHRGLYDTGSAADIVMHYVLPVLSLALFLTARNHLIMRGGVLQEKIKPYVLFARAKGLRGPRILFRHVVRNASLPVVTLIALDIGFIFSGALFIEIVYSMPGMGLLIYEALLNRDYPVLQGIFLVIAVMVITANLVMDLIYPLLDPRVRKRW